MKIIATNKVTKFFAVMNKPEGGSKKMLKEILVGFLSTGRKNHSLLNDQNELSKQFRNAVTRLS